MTQPTMRIVTEDSLEDDNYEPIPSDLLPVDLNELDDDTEGEISAKQVTQDQLDDEPHQEYVENTLILDILRKKGIEDPTKILFEEEDGSQTETNFFELTPEEQIAILTSDESEMDYGLEEHEIDAVNMLRENKMTLDELIQYYKDQAIEEYRLANETQEFEVSSFTDEELYVLDLKAKFEELTDDELRTELEKALENPDLFKKKIDRIRTDYEALEKEERELALNQASQEEQQQYQEVIDAISGIAEATEDMYGIELEAPDKEDILSLLTDRDLNGVSPLAKDLNDPQKLFKVAWFLSKGDEAFNILHNYYKKEIENVRKVSYEKGKVEAIKGAPSKPVNIITRPGTQPNQPAQSKQRFRSIDELHSMD